MSVIQLPLIFLYFINFFIVSGYFYNGSLMEQIQILKSDRGYSLKYQGYTFWKVRVAGTKIYWKCSRNRRGGCNARLNTIGYSEANVTHGLHNHEPC